MSAPGVPGQTRRRMVAGSVAALGLLDVWLAAERHPVIRVGPIHNEIHHIVVHGSRYVLLVAALALLGSARGLLHGKRHAWYAALVACGFTFVAHSFKRADLLGIGATVAVGVLLLTSTRLFPARSDPHRARQGIAWLVLGELGVFVYGVAGLYLLDRNFREPTELGESMSQAFAMLVLLPSTTIEPVTRHGAWFIDSVRVMAALVLGIALWHFLHPVIHRLGAGRAERAEVERLLKRYAATSLAYFHLLNDKAYLFDESGDAFIGYRVVGGTAVALGEPIGSPEACESVTRAFAEFCDLNGWAFCFHQVTEEGAALLRRTGLTPLKLGEEAIIPVQEFSLTGKSFKHLRNVTNRLERDGYTVGSLPQPLSAANLDELEEVSDAWLAHGGHRERQFTLGSFSRQYMLDTEVVAVRSPGGRIEAFANIIPAYQSDAGAPDGVMDYLFAALIDLFKERGFRGMNLGFAPLSNIEGTGLVARALRLFYERGGRAFNFRGLRSFKDKWRPRWEARYLVYRSEIQLPEIALAIARVGERGSILPRWRPWRRGGAAAPTASRS